MGKSSKSEAPAKSTGMRRHNRSNRKTLYVGRDKATSEPEWNMLGNGLMQHRKHGNIIKTVKGGFVSVRGPTKRHLTAAKSEDVVAALKKVAENEAGEKAA